MTSIPRYRIYVDTEYAYPGMRSGTPRPTSADQRQIVQIAAIRWDTKTGNEVDHYDVLVHPEYLATLPRFFTELTGITQDQVEAGAISFREALQSFYHFCNNDPVWTFDKDEEVFRQNCAYINIPFPFTVQFTRVKAVLPQWGIDPMAYSSGTLYKAAGLNMNGQVHNALHDVRSMAAAIQAFADCTTR